MLESGNFTGNCQPENVAILIDPKTDCNCEKVMENWKSQENVQLEKVETIENDNFIK